MFVFTHSVMRPTSDPLPRPKLPFRSTSRMSKLPSSKTRDLRYRERERAIPSHSHPSPIHTHSHPSPIPLPSLSLSHSSPHSSPHHSPLTLPAIQHQQLSTAPPIYTCIGSCQHPEYTRHLIPILLFITAAPKWPPTSSSSTTRGATRSKSRPPAH